MIDLGGIIPAIATPMLDGERLDFDAIGPYVDWLAGTGALGLAVNVDTGEGPHLTRDERREVLEAVRAAAAGRLRIIAGVGGPSTADGIANARIARDAGADALLVFPIGAFLSQPLRADMVVAYHRAIADATGLPLILFQLQPMLGGVLYPDEVLDGLLEVPGVAAIKEASFDPLRWLALKAFLDARGQPITLLTGNDSFIAESFLLGAQGALLGFATLLTAEHVALQAAAEAGDVPRAREIGARIQRLADVIFAPPVADYRARTKEALTMLGVLPRAVTRPPLLPVDDAERARIRAALVAAELLDA
ncbi:MAG: dihydrodipicolinate synthase family protein [Chloroflexi bacterium]|nr:dihydrodipicolinate synthase family protein [Chloroflexota bacterium]